MSPKVRSVLALLLVALLAVTLLAGCDREGTDTTSDQADDPVASDDTDVADDVDEPADEGPDVTENTSLAWLDFELTDAVTGETFRISDYKGSPVLLHAFAVW